MLERPPGGATMHLLAEQTPSSTWVPADGDNFPERNKGREMCEGKREGVILRSVVSTFLVHKKLNTKSQTFQIQDFPLTHTPVLEKYFLDQKSQIPPLSQSHQYYQ